jgi:hypothetical protein
MSAFVKKYHIIGISRSGRIPFEKKPIKLVSSLFEGPISLLIGCLEGEPFNFQRISLSLREGRPE